MGFAITRQRYYSNNMLAVEIACGGNKFVGKDKLDIRYDHLLEGKNLVSPVDSVNCAKKIYKSWVAFNGDELKYITISNYDSKGGKLVFDPNSKRDLEKLDKWAENELNNMAKCGHCSRLMGAKDPFETEDLPNKIFCSEVCLSLKYKIIHGVEAPKIASNKNKKTIKK